jgi:hypothetical protein
MCFPNLLYPRDSGNSVEFPHDVRRCPPKVRIGLVREEHKTSQSALAKDVNLLCIDKERPKESRQ